MSFYIPYTQVWT